MNSIKNHNYNDINTTQIHSRTRTQRDRTKDDADEADDDDDIHESHNNFQLTSRVHNQIQLKCELVDRSERKANHNDLLCVSFGVANLSPISPCLSNTNSSFF